MPQPILRGAISVTSIRRAESRPYFQVAINLQCRNSEVPKKGEVDNPCPMPGCQDGGHDGDEGL